ncbi:MAG: Uncharacterised protein [Rhodospirillaceae bacterium]|nr:MAG: Uncharacterised protein [Rhodospirillaceae bacterium]
MQPKRVGALVEGNAVGCSGAQVVDDERGQGALGLKHGQKVLVAVQPADQAPRHVWLPGLPVLALFPADFGAHDLEVDGAVLIGADEPVLARALEAVFVTGFARGDTFERKGWRL